MWGKFLDLIAEAYFFFYHKICQLGEPFTRIFCRIEQNTPYLFWGLILFWVYKANSSWWAIPTNLFFVWFIPHIVRYRVAHTTDNPPYLLNWVIKRIKIRRNRNAT